MIWSVYELQSSSDGSHTILVSVLRSCIIPEDGSVLMFVLASRSIQSLFESRNKPVSLEIALGHSLQEGLEGGIIEKQVNAPRDDHAWSNKSVRCVTAP